MDNKQLANMVLREGPSIHSDALVNRAANFLNAERTKDSNLAASKIAGLDKQQPLVELLQRDIHKAREAQDAFVKEYETRRTAVGK